ncbi:CWF19-like protein 2 [Ruditapes philippinarum]|uniref:CWF19-like protein 2 n=1 Tax=Ruditapes philippinarum TaxID=129788 RepID=UPI00295B2526|nr:CWF19-like protein 2 [Ruditapes philippinarum]
MNDLGAKIVKAEIMGNEEQAAKLKAQLEAAREAKKNAPAVPQGQGRKKHDDDDFVTLTRTDRSGLARPVPDSQHPVESGGKRRRKKQKIETHTGKQGERTQYFDDDDKFDLKTLVEREKMGTAEDQNQMFARLAGRAAQKTDDDFQVDDVFLSKANRKQSESILEQKDKAAAIYEHKKMAASLEKCRFCFGNVPKHLIIAIGTKVYLCLPNNKSLSEGHCLIVPMQHVASGTTVDEDVWSEIQVFRRTLTKMFADRDEDVVFMETSMKLKQFPHMCIECVPMDKEVGDLAPIYFKKAIQESESEWSQNKKVVDLSQKDIRHSVPKGFPYFAVDFGNQGGFAHVIEDEIKFPYYFGKEIIGGMIDADHRLWKKPPKENFDEQKKSTLVFYPV